MSTFALLGMLSNFAPSYGMEVPEEDALKVKKILTPLSPPKKKTSFSNKKIERENLVEESYLQYIPDETLGHILSFVGAQTAQAASKVCSKFAHLILENGSNFNEDGELTSFIPHPVNIFFLLQNMVSETPPALAFLDPQDPNLDSQNSPDPDPDSNQNQIVVKRKNEIIENTLLAMANDPTSFPFLARLFAHFDPVVDFQAVDIASTLVQRTPALQALLKKARTASDFPIDQFFEILDNPEGLPQPVQVGESVERVTPPADLQKLHQNLMITKILRDAGDSDAQTRLNELIQHIRTNSSTGATYINDDFLKQNKILLEQLWWGVYTDDYTVITSALEWINTFSGYFNEDESARASFENFGRYYFSKPPQTPQQQLQGLQQQLQLIQQQLQGTQQQLQGTQQHSQLTQQQQHTYFYTLLHMYKQHSENQNHRQKRLRTLDAAYDTTDPTDVATLLSLGEKYSEEGQAEKASQIIGSVLLKLTDQQVAENSYQLLNFYRRQNDKEQVLKILDRALKGTIPSDVATLLSLGEEYLREDEVEKCSQIVDSLEDVLTDEQIADNYHSFLRIYGRQNKKDKVLEILNRAYAGVSQPSDEGLEILNRAYAGVSDEEPLQDLMKISGIADSYFEEGYYEKSREVYEDLLKLFGKAPASIKVKFDIAKCMLALGNKGDFPTIEEYIQMALQLFKNKKTLSLCLSMDTTTSDNDIEDEELDSIFWLRKGAVLALKAALGITQEKFEEAYEDLLTIEEEGYYASSSDSEDSQSVGSAAADIVDMFDEGLMKAFQTQIDNPKMPQKLTDFIKKKVKELIESKNDLEELVANNNNNDDFDDLNSFHMSNIREYEKFMTTYKDVIDRLLKDDSETVGESGNAEGWGKEEEV